MAGWDEADQLHLWVLELDCLGSNPGVITFFLMILVNILNLTKLNFPDFKEEFTGIVGETNEMMHIKSSALCMVHGKPLVVIDKSSQKQK